MWREVELRELRVFLVLADELHFGRTAERIGLTQARVSQTLRSLEVKLGAELIRRTSRRVELTAAGHQFRARVEAQLRGLEGVLEATEKAAARITSPVRLGVVSAAMIGPAVGRIIEAYEAAHPDSAVELIGLPFRDRFGPIRRGEVEVMVVSLPLDESDLSTGKVLARDPRMLAVGRSHPLAERDEVSVEDLADYVIGDLDIVAPRSLIEEMAPRATPTGRPIARIRVRAEEPSTLIMAVASGRIVQPVTDAFAATYAHPDVTYIRIADLPPSRTALAWRRRNRHPALRAFLRIAEATPAPPKLSSEVTR